MHTHMTVAPTRMEQGNFSNTQGVGAGVYEYKIDFGAGYRKDIRPHRNAGPITNEGRNRRFGNGLHP